jgi:hypothetical protein
MERSRDANDDLFHHSHSVSLHLRSLPCHRPGTRRTECLFSVGRAGPRRALPPGSASCLSFPMHGEWPCNAGGRNACPRCGRRTRCLPPGVGEQDAHPLKAGKMPALRDQAGKMPAPRKAGETLALRKQTRCPPSEGDRRPVSRLVAPGGAGSARPLPVCIGKTAVPPAARSFPRRIDKVKALCALWALPARSAGPAQIHPSSNDLLRIYTIQKPNIQA